MATAKKPARRKPSPKSPDANGSKAKARKPAKAAAKTKPRSESARPLDVGKLLDHPLVADLLAVGAMAAVAAIADHHVRTRTGEIQKGSKLAVKAAGAAAAAAIGRRLMTEVALVRKPKTKS